MTASGLSLDIIGLSPSRSLVLCLVSIDISRHRPTIAFLQPTSEIAFLQFVLEPARPHSQKQHDDKSYLAETIDRANKALLRCDHVRVRH
jgi:hypothetical protein